MKTPEHYVAHLGMQPHPEGGWFKETYRSAGNIPGSVLNDFDGDRSFSTGIYFLLTKENFSAFHRIKSDEMWHFYDGDGLTVHEIRPDGKYIEHKLGLDLNNGEQPQLIIFSKQLVCLSSEKWRKLVFGRLYRFTWFRFSRF